MRVAACLLAYSMIVLALGPRLLVRSTSAGSAPRLGILAWQVACWSVVGSWVLAGLATASPSVLPAGGLSGVLHACVAMVRQTMAPPDSLRLRLLGAAVAMAVGARVAWCLLHGLWADRRRRLRHGAMVMMVGRPLGELGAVVIDRAEPVVYCLPGRAGRIVATTGALDRLTGGQLRAVLAHEQAHLRGRHHLVLSAAHSLARAFPRVPLFVLASTHTARLVEMCADDTAARRHGRWQVAEALVALADGPVPREALAAAGVRTVQRVERLLAGRAHRARSSSMLLALVALLLTGPVVAAAAPVFGAAFRHWGLCPLA